MFCQGRVRIPCAINFVCILYRFPNMPIDGASLEMPQQFLSTRIFTLCSEWAITKSALVQLVTYFL